MHSCKNGRNAEERKKFNVLENNVRHYVIKEERVVDFVALLFLLSIIVHLIHFT